MPWCPYCKTEYQSGVTHCSDCGAPLVEELPSHTDPASPRPVFLTEIRRDVDAALVVQLLEDNGIPVLQHGCLEADHLALLYTGTTLCGRKLYVSEDQLEQASELLQVYQNQQGQFLYDADAFVTQAEEPSVSENRHPIWHWILRLGITASAGLLIAQISPILGILSFGFLLITTWIVP